MPFTQGQILEDKYGIYKVLGVVGEVYILSAQDKLEYAGPYLFTEKDLVKGGCKPVAEKWKLESGQPFFFIDSDGEIDSDFFDIDSEGFYKYRYSIGNCFKTKEETEKYRQWLLDNPYPQDK